MGRANGVEPKPFLFVACRATKGQGAEAEIFSRPNSHYCSSLVKWLSTAFLVSYLTDNETRSACGVPPSPQVLAVSLTSVGGPDGSVFPSRENNGSPVTSKFYSDVGRNAFLLLRFVLGTVRLD